MDSPYPNRASQQNRSPFRWYVLGILILVGMFLIGYLPKYRNNRELSSMAHDVATAPLSVEILRPRLATPEALNLPGNIEAIATTSVQARSNGYITKLWVDIGSHVKAGQVLADVESPDVDQQVLQANSQTAQSRATVAQSQSEVERLQAAQSQSLADVSHQRAAVVQAVAAVESATAQKSQAQAALLGAKAGLLRSEQQVKVQQAAYAQAEAQFALATANVKRYTALLSQGFVSQQDYDQAQATYRTNGAVIASANANILAAEADVKAAEETVKSNEELVRAAEANRRSALANVKAVEATLQSSQANLEASKASVVSGRAVVRANQAAVGSSVANESRYGVLKSFEHVVAPFPGIITSRNVDVGSLVSPGTIAPTDSSSSTPTSGLFGIARVDTLRIFVNVPQSEYAVAKAGTEARIVVREIPHHAFYGRVFETAGAFSETTRTVQTEIRLPNPSGILVPGMYAMVNFSGGMDKELRVPADALINDASGTRVAVVDTKNKVHFRTIVLGRDYGSESAVVSGLAVGDRLVSNPGDDLQDGMEVTVAKAGGKPSSSR